MKFIIEGGKKLEGDVWISGAKNAALPIIAATLLTDDECVLDNMPRLSDVETLLNILRSLGSSVVWTGEHQVTMCNRNATLHHPDYQLVKGLRASILLLGSFLVQRGLNMDQALMHALFRHAIAQQKKYLHLLLNPFNTIPDALS